MTESSITKLSMSLDDIDALIQIAARSPLSQAELLFVRQKAEQLQADRQRMAVARWQERQGAERSQEAEQAAPRQYTAGDMEAVDELGQPGEVEEHRPLGGYPDSYSRNNRNGPERAVEGIDKNEPG